MIGPVRTLGEMITAAAAVWGDRPALIFEDQTVSYRQLAARARALAARLLGSGLVPGDRVAVWLPNGPAFVELTLGCAMAGLVLVPLNTRLRVVDAADSLRKSGARALFFGDAFLGIDFTALVGEILAQPGLDALRLLVVLGGDGGGGVRSLAAWEAETPAAAELPAVAADAPATINFTSGTTASPKGAVILHRTLLHIARAVGRRMNITSADRMVSAMPFYHNGGLVPTLLTSLASGCALYTQARFDPDWVLDCIGRHACTLVGGVGTMFTMMMDSPGFARVDLRSVRAVRITGPADMRRLVHERFARPTLYSLYGMTESTAAVTLTRPEDSLDEQVHTNGKPLPGAAIRIVGADGAELPPGEAGEIWIGGEDCLMRGYFRDPAATAAVLTADGWLRSGDLGVIDGRGNLVLVGRLKDMYRSGGENVACAEVEEFLRGHPAVLHAAVLGVPEPRLDEVGLAFIELRPGHQASAEELQAHCRRSLANFKVPRHVVFRQGLPLTVSGRVEKHRLRDEALALAGAGRAGGGG